VDWPAVLLMTNAFAALKTVKLLQKASDTIIDQNANFYVKGCTSRKIQRESTLGRK